MKEIISTKQFENEIAVDKLQLFIFYRTNCCVCDSFFDDLKKRNISDGFVININDDVIYYKTKLGVWQVPRTRIYYKSMLMWENGGILYDTQIQEMFKILRNEKRL